MIKVKIKNSASQAISGIIFSEGKLSPVRSFASIGHAEEWLDQWNKQTKKTLYLQAANEFDDSEVDYYALAR